MGDFDIQHNINILKRHLSKTVDYKVITTTTVS